eukprot:gb/GFBE01038939.1/.p1 GENE.gb/GFBE01038939.1/~~gb/GFBE01038939.1/.p1  ORF type:complete len:649 (+),score=309.20 gb/GFBE01038939.1/:1-1947(+)
MQIFAAAFLALLPQLAAAGLLFDEAEARARPITKVVGLLMGMKEQMEKEAKSEDEIMEKYNCWCKENGEDKAAAILTAEQNMKDWEARVSQLAADSKRLEVEYTNLAKDLEKDEASMDKSMMLRKKEVAEFTEEEADLLNSLNSVESAIDTVGGSFLQTPQKSLTRAVKSILATHADKLSDESTAKASAFLQDPSTGGVQGVLDGLKGDFSRSLKDLQDAETKNKADYEKLIGAKRKEIDAAKIQIAEKKEQKAAADEERMHKKRAIKEAKESSAEDLAFANEVKEKCRVKNQEYEKRQATRAEESEAVSKAIQVLDADEAHDNFAKTMSFLQVASSDDAARRQRASDALAAAGRSRDERLVTLSLEAKLDGFERVKEKINIMVGALKKEQADEVRKKEYCIEEFQQNKLAVQEKKSADESVGAKMGELQMKLQEAEEAMKGLQAEIAEVKKQQQLAAQNREKENSEFQAVVQEQRETQTLLKKAMHVLGQFYNKKEEAFVQSSQPIVKEPETFSSYKRSSASTGVMSMLQQLIADAVEMEKESTHAERESQEDYEAFGKDLAASLVTKNKEVADKAEEKAQAETKLVEARESKEGLEAALDGLKDTEFELHETCDFTLQNFDARQKARTEEIEALAQAKSYLNGAKL